VRSAAGFGVKRIILTRDAANPYHPKSIRSSAGAVFEVEFVRGPRLEDFQVIMEPSEEKIFTLINRALRLTQSLSLKSLL
jgi:tRNA G18 (ribose-2'-O)-methylase SpoU